MIRVIHPTPLMARSMCTDTHRDKAQQKWRPEMSYCNAECNWCRIPATVTSTLLIDTAQSVSAADGYNLTVTVLR